MAKHDPVTQDEIRERLDDLHAKLKARQGYAAFAENCVAIQKEMERLESLLK